MLLLLIATLFVFGRVLTFDFVKWDDDVNTYANPNLNPPTWGALRYYATHLYYNVYMPVTWAVWLVTAMAAYLPNAPPDMPPLNPYLFHALSLATHAIAALLVYLVLRQLRFDPWPACAGALVFAVHPLQIESVAWISAYNVPLCGAFAMLAIWQYLRSADATNAKQRRRRYAWATLAFVLALLSKPMAVTVPFVVIAIDVLLLRRPWRAALRGTAPWLALGVAFAILTASWQTKRELAEVWPLWTRLLIAADAVAFYLRKLVWPFGMTLDHGRTRLAALSDPHLLWTVLLPILLLAALWLARDRARPLLAGLVIGVAGMLPVLGLAPFDFQQFSTVADRYAYLALLGAAIAVAWLISRAPRSAGPLACVLLAVLLAAAAWHQVGHWRNSHTLFARSTSVNPRSGVSWLNWGAVLIGENRAHEAIHRLRRAIAILHDYHDARLNLGTALYNAGDIPGALRERRRLLALFPDSPAAHVALGDFHADLGDRAAAAAAYEAALLLRPTSPVIKARLARLAQPASAASTQPETSPGMSRKANLQEPVGAVLGDQSLPSLPARLDRATIRCKLTRPPAVTPVRSSRFGSSSMVEQSAVNRPVVGSSPTCRVFHPPCPEWDSHR